MPAGLAGEGTAPRCPRRSLCWRTALPRAAGTGLGSALRGPCSWRHQVRVPEKWRRSRGAGGGGVCGSRSSSEPPAGRWCRARAAGAEGGRLGTGRLTGACACGDSRANPGKRHALRAAGSGAGPAAGVVGPARQGQRASGVQLPARCSEPEPRHPAAGSRLPFRLQFPSIVRHLKTRRGSRERRPILRMRRNEAK